MALINNFDEADFSDIYLKEIRHEAAGVWFFFAIPEIKDIDIRHIIQRVLQHNNDPALEFIDRLEDIELKEFEQLVTEISASSALPDTVRFQLSGPDFVTLLDHNDGTAAVMVASGNKKPGSYELHLTVTDAMGWLLEETIPLTILPDRPPQLSGIELLTVKEAQEKCRIIRAADPYGKDEEIEFHLLSAPGFVTLTDQHNGSAELFARPGFDDVGRHKAIIKAVHKNGLSTSTAINIAVKNVKRPPILSPVPPIEIGESDFVSVPLIAVDPDSAHEALKFELVAAKNLNFVTLEQSARQRAALLLMPGYKDAGNYTFVVRVSDSEGGVAE